MKLGMPAKPLAPKVSASVANFSVGIIQETYAYPDIRRKSNPR